MITLTLILIYISHVAHAQKYPDTPFQLLYWALYTNEYSQLTQAFSGAHIGCIISLEKLEQLPKVTIPNGKWWRSMNSQTHAAPEHWGVVMVHHPSPFEMSWSGIYDPHHFLTSLMLLWLIATAPSQHLVQPRPSQVCYCSNLGTIS